ncbi:Dabb family protein [Candidatus Latescibacterota bacterium]
MRSTLKKIMLVLTIFALLAPSSSWCADRVKLVIIGDSTVQTFGEERDKRGWGQYFDELFSDNIDTVNLAKSGRSTKTFIDEGLWEEALVEKGNYVLIQFGHNDSHPKERPESTDAATDYRDYLRQYIDEAQAQGAKPVLITPMHRRLFNGGLPTIELAPYVNAMKAVASEKNVPLIDLHERSGKVLVRLGDDGSEFLYVSPKDRTHFSERGARLMAGFVADELGVVAPELKQYLKKGSGKMLRHVVLFKFKDGTSDIDIAHVEEAFSELPDKIEVIHDFEYGTNVSSENLSQGFTHCFFLSFLTAADRDNYLPHPAHKAFGKVLSPHVDKVLVVDYFVED